MNENKTNINWDIRIFRKIDLNYGKYWIFNIEIFTFLINIIKIL